MDLNPFETIKPMEADSHDLSDIIDIIETETNGLPGPSSQMQAQASSSSSSKKAQIVIVEQPRRKNRFRYECEGELASLIYGERFTPERRTFPVVEVINCSGTIMLLASCVSDEEPYRPHPHKLVGNECKKGCYQATSSGPNYRFTLSNICVQNTKIAFIKESLEQRKSINVDPFKTGFDHLNERKKINLYKLRLCFQAFQVVNKGTKTNLIPLCDPVVSKVLCNTKSICDLKIFELCRCAAPYEGGAKMILLSSKIRPDDIAVRFFAKADGRIVWHTHAKFSPNDVHKGCAITFQTPHYPYEELPKHAKVYIQLERPSDEDLSEPLEFEFTESKDVFRDRNRLAGRKRLAAATIPELQNCFENPGVSPNTLPGFTYFKNGIASLNIQNTETPEIKAEIVPAAISPANNATTTFGQYRTNYQMSPGPATNLEPPSPVNYNFVNSPGASETPTAAKQPVTEQNQICTMLSNNSLNNAPNFDMFPDFPGFPTNQEATMDFNTYSYNTPTLTANTNPFAHHNGQHNDDTNDSVTFTTLQNYTEHNLQTNYTNMQNNNTPMLYNPFLDDCFPSIE